MDARGTHVGGHKPWSAHLRFLKDVLYGLHGFATKDTCSSLKKTHQKSMFSHSAESLCPKPQKLVLEPSKGTPKLRSGTSWRHPEQASKTDHLKKWLLSLLTNRGICCFRALDPRNGTPIIYRWYILSLMTLEDDFALHTATALLSNGAVRFHFFPARQRGCGWKILHSHGVSENL